MARSTRGIILVSSILFIGSFILSIQANIWTDALYRSVLVFGVSALGMYAFFRLWNAVQKQAYEQVQLKVDQENDAVRDEGKGEQIDFATPDEDFVPWEHVDQTNSKEK